MDYFNKIKNDFPFIQPLIDCHIITDQTAMIYSIKCDFYDLIKQGLTRGESYQILSEIYPRSYESIKHYILYHEMIVPDQE